jgi:hypothetical protein
MYNVEISKGEKVRLVAVGQGCSVSIQDITVDSPTPTELKYYSVASSGWVDTHVAIPMVSSPSDTSISFLTLDSSVLSTSAIPQQYLILTHDAQGDLIDAMVLRVGAVSKAQIERISLAVAPARREVSRITDTTARISLYSDAAGTSEKIRFQVDQDVSGNQPEEIQLDVSGTIG